jgi:hypothetical protein
MFVEGTRLEGKLEIKFEIASNLMNMGVEEKKILEATGLNADQLEALKANKAQ